MNTKFQAEVKEVPVANTGVNSGIIATVQIHKQHQQSGIGARIPQNKCTKHYILKVSSPP